MVKFRYIFYAKFKSRNNEREKEIRVRPTEDGPYSVVNYDNLGQMFGINLRGKNRDYYLQPSGEIDTTIVPEAYRWIFFRGFSPSLHISAKDPMKTLDLYGIVHSYDGSFANRFTIQGGIEFSDAKYMAMVSEQVDVMETEINGYRGTDLTQMPFNLNRIDIVTNKPVVANLETALKGWGIGDKAFKLFQWAARSPKSESVYPELPIALQQFSERAAKRTLLQY